MKGWHLSKELAVGLGFTFILGGLILYIGYLNSEAHNSLERPHEISNRSGDAVFTAFPQIDSELTRASGIKAEQTAKIIAQDQKFEEEIKLVFGNRLSKDNSAGIEDFPSPVQGKPLRDVGTYYSEGRGDYIFHAGSDYPLLEGTVIRATHGGEVIFAGEDPILGQKVILDCGEGWQVIYGGLDNLRVQEGEVIESKEALGQVGVYPGAESQSNSPQLHYEVWHNGQVQRFSH